MKTGQSVEVRFLGQKIALRSQESDPAIIQQVVDLVSSQLNEVEKKNPGGAPHQIALLALLNLAEEYVRAKGRIQDYQQRLDEKLGQVLRSFEVPGEAPGP